VTDEGEVDGHLVSLPQVEIHTIGAGGGSIAWVDEGGILRVGPKSAGAIPGPACYGEGGNAPTCTDADLLLGYLDPDFFLGGRVRLHVQLAEAAIRTIGDRLGLDPVEAAAGIFDVANVNMAAGINEITVQRGYDPRDFVVVAAGGAGGIHGAMIAAELSVSRIVIPRHSAVLCAMGMLLTDIKSYPTSLGNCDIARLRSLVLGMREKGTRALKAEGVDDEAMRFTLTFEMRYVGQHHEVTVPVEIAALQGDDVLETLEVSLATRHNDLYGFALRDASCEIMVLRLTARGERTAPDLALKALPPVGPPAPKSTRSIYISSTREFVSVDVFDGGSIAPGARILGPALVDATTTTVLIPPDYEASCDHLGSFVLTRT
jgi:N-methylhydantoinase A